MTFVTKPIKIKKQVQEIVTVSKPLPGQGINIAISGTNNWISPNNITDVPNFAQNLVSTADVNLQDLEIRLSDNLGNLIGDNKASGGNWTTFALTTLYGGAISDDDWNAGLTPAIVNSAAFGLNIRATQGGSPNTARIRARDWGFAIPASADILSLTAGVNKVRAYISGRNIARIFYCTMEIKYEIDEVAFKVIATKIKLGGTFVTKPVKIKQ